MSQPALVAALALTLAAGGTPAAAEEGIRACPLVYPVAPDEAAARRIAEAVIAARPHPPHARYVLKVKADRDEPLQWLAFQMLPPPPKPRPGVLYLQAGGGGVQMRIDRCTGAVSDLHYVR